MHGTYLQNASCAKPLPLWNLCWVFQQHVDISSGSNAEVNGQRLVAGLATTNETCSGLLSIQNLQARPTHMMWSLFKLIAVQPTYQLKLSMHTDV